MVSYNKNKVMYDLSKFITEGGGGGGTSDHSKLENRSAANQHPITAITNLQESLASKQPTISDLSTIRSNAQAGKSASDEIATYGDIVTHNALEFALKSEIPDLSKYALDSGVVHKTGNETIGGVKTFNGGSGGNSVGIISLTGMLIGSVNSTAYTQYGTVRKCNNKAHTGSYYMYSDGSLFFRHKTGTATAEGTVNDATLFLHPVNGLQAAWSGRENVDAGTPHDVLVDTINYIKLNTNTKDVLGAINELNNRIIELENRLNG